MRSLYTIAFTLAQPFILLHLIWRGFRNHAYWRRWRERFGRPPAGVEGSYDIWIHAVSVGEAQAAAPLIQRLLKQHAGLRLLVTTTTPTGSERVRRLFAEQVDHMYAPYDLPGVVGAFLSRVRPRVALFMETELWPNTFYLCRRAGIPVVVANARLSQRSAGGYGRFPALVREMLSQVTELAAQSEDDARRFAELGMPVERIQVTGSIKFDVYLPASIRERAQALRRCWGVDRSVLIAASTHEGEDALILDAFQKILELRPDTLLVIAPRHPERFSQVVELAGRAGYATGRRSQMPDSCGALQVFVGDTMGELPVFYAAADVAFVGGSLVPTGGHNMLEPAALGVPVLTGPHLFNFSRIGELMLSRGAANLVRNADELAEQAGLLLADANRRQAMGERGLQVVEENRGALEKLTGIVEAQLDR